MVPPHCQNYTTCLNIINLITHHGDLRPLLSITFLFFNKFHHFLGSFTTLLLFFFIHHTIFCIYASLFSLLLGCSMYLNHSNSTRWNSLRRGKHERSAETQETSVVWSDVAAYSSATINPKVQTSSKAKTTWWNTPEMA